MSNLKSFLITYYSLLAVVHIRMNAESRDLYLTHVVGTQSSICCINKQIKSLDRSPCARYRLEYKTIVYHLKSQRAYSLFKLASHKCTKSQYELVVVSDKRRRNGIKTETLTRSIQQESFLILIWVSLSSSSLTTPPPNSLPTHSLYQSWFWSY